MLDGLSAFPFGLSLSFVLSLRVLVEIWLLVTVGLDIEVVADLAVGHGCGVLIAAQETRQLVLSQILCLLGCLRR